MSESAKVQDINSAFGKYLECLAPKDIWLTNNPSALSAAFRLDTFCFSSSPSFLSSLFPKLVTGTPIPSRSRLKVKV
jgi:hypothetical protein